MALLGNLTGSSHLNFQDRTDFYNGVATTSLRFDDGDTVNLNLTSSQAPTSTALATFSCWVKRCDLGSACSIFGTNGSGTSGDNASWIAFTSANYLDFANVSGGSYTGRQRTTMQFRDTAAWYHIVVRIDLANSTASNRVRIYVNGSLAESAFVRDSGAPAAWASDGAMQLTTAVASARIGAIGYATANPYDGYLADVNLVDGASLAPASFGEDKNGVWIPIAPAVSEYGNCGFRLQFLLKGTAQDADGMGADTSGKARHFAKSSGNVASDSAMPDSPENNFCTLNSNALFQQGTLSEGNLKFVGDGGNNWDETSSTFGVSSGKWYWEVKFLSIQQLNSNIAGIRQTGRTSAGPWYGSNTAVSDIGVEFGVMDVNGLVTNSSGSGTLTMDIAAGDVVQFRLDLDDNELSVSVDGDDKGKAWDITANIEYTPSSTVYNSSSVIYNFGQDSSFAGTETATSNTDGNGFGTFHSAVPSGYLALCTANLPEPTIGANSATQADDHFNTVIYTGDGATRSITGVGFQPDWLWIKGRNYTFSHILFDSNRGAGKYVRSDSTGAEADYGQTSFDTDGYSMAGTMNAINENNRPYVAWNWKANGGTTVTNEAGSIDSTVQANTDAGFSIVTFTKGSNVETVGHGLSVALDLLIVKRRNGTGSWAVYHSANTANPETDYLRLNLANATADDATFWGDTAPTTSVFSIGAAFNSGETLVCYAFHSVEGYSKIGSYTGNGNADGTFVYTGFRPAWILIKRTDAAEDWWIHDTKRNTFNPVDKHLYANANNAEATETSEDLLSNGFKLRTSNANWNVSGGTFIYMAFAEAPFKYANAR